MKVWSEGCVIMVQKYFNNNNASIKMCETTHDNRQGIKYFAQIACLTAIFVDHYLC